MSNYTSQKTDPQNVEYFSFFYDAVEPIPIIQRLAQTISAIFSGVTLFLFIHPKIDPYLPEWIAILIAAIIAIPFALFVEKMIASFLPATVRQLAWYGLKFKNGKYMGMFWVLAILSLFAIGINGMFNYIAKDEIAENAAGEAKTTDLLQVQQSGDNKKTLILDAYKVDKEDFDILWKDNRQAIIDKYDAKIEAQRNKIQTNERKAANGHKWAKSHAEVARATIPRLKEEKARKLEQWATDKKTALSELEARRDDKLAQQDTNNDQTVLIAQTDNNEKKEKHQIKENRYKNLSGIFAAGSLLITILCICINEIFKAGSEISTTILKTREPLLQAIFRSIGEWIDRLIRDIFTIQQEQQIAPIPVRNNAQNTPVVVTGFGSNNNTDNMPTSSDSKLGTQAVMHNGQPVTHTVIGFRILDYSKRIEGNKKSLAEATKKGYRGKVKIYSEALQNNISHLQYWEAKKQEWETKFNSL